MSLLHLPLELTLYIVRVGQLDLGDVIRLSSTCRQLRQLQPSLISVLDTSEKEKLVPQRAWIGTIEPAFCSVARLVEGGAFDSEFLLKHVDIFFRSWDHALCRAVLDCLVKGDLTAEIARENSIMARACTCGHLSLVKHLLSTTGLTMADVMADGNAALREACENGHCALVQYLFEDVGLTAEDARALNNHALRKACRNGHLQVVKYLIEDIGLTAEDARSFKNDGICIAIVRGNVAMVKYLVETVGLTAEDARTYNNHGLLKACDAGHLEMVRYLFETVGLTIEDARNSGRMFSALENASRTPGHPHLVRYLVENLALTADDSRLAYVSASAPIQQYLLQKFPSLGEA